MEKKRIEWKNHFFLFYFIEFLYLCRGFHILYPSSTQGLPKV